MTTEEIYYIIASAALPIAAGWALVQWMASLRLRRRELRWRQAEAAWQLLDKIFEDPAAVLAFELIDDERDTVDVPGRGSVYVSREDMLSAFDVDAPLQSAATPQIRYSFNSILYAFDRLETAIASKYVLEEDVVSPTAYYAELFYKIWPQITPYAENAGYYRALTLIHRLRNGPAAPAKVPWARPADRLIPAE